MNKMRSEQQGMQNTHHGAMDSLPQASSAIVEQQQSGANSGTDSQHQQPQHGGSSDASSTQKQPQSTFASNTRPAATSSVAMDPLLKAQQQSYSTTHSAPTSTHQQQPQKQANFASSHISNASDLYDPTATSVHRHHGNDDAHMRVEASPGTKRTYGTPTAAPKVPKYSHQQHINTSRAQTNPLRSNGSTGTPTHTGHMSYAAANSYGRRTPSTPSSMRTPGTPSGQMTTNFNNFGSPSSSQYYQQQQQQQYQYPPELITQSPISAHVQADIPEEASSMDPSRLAALARPEKSIKETFISEDGQKITVVSVKKRKNFALTPQQRAQMLQAQQKQQSGRATKKRKLNGKPATTKKKTTTKGKKKAATPTTLKNAVNQQQNPSNMFSIPMQPLLPNVTPSGMQHPGNTFQPSVGHIYGFPKNSHSNSPVGTFNPHFQYAQHGIKPPQPRGAQLGHDQQQNAVNPPQSSMVGPQQHVRPPHNVDSASSLQSTVSPQSQHPQYHHSQHQASTVGSSFTFATPGTPSGTPSQYDFSNAVSQQGTSSDGTPVGQLQGAQQFYYPTVTPTSPSSQPYQVGPPAARPPPQAADKSANNPFANAPGMMSQSAARKRKAEIDESLHCEIRISNLPDELCCNETYLRQLFSECGDVFHLRVPTLALPFALNKPKYKGVAYVKYTTLVGADRAIRKFHDQTVSGKRLRVEIFQLPKVAPGSGKTGGASGASQSFESTELYVVNLPHAILNDDAAVQHMWEQYGPVISCAVPKSANGLPSGYIFVKYKYARDAKNALSMNNTFHHGRRIQVRFADKKHQNRNNFSGYTSWVFIGGLNPNTSTTELRQVFGAYGQIEEIDDSQIESKAYAFLKYRSVESVREALRFKRDGVYVLERMNQSDESAVTKQLAQRDEMIDDLDEDPDDPYLPEPLTKELFAWRGHQPMYHQQQQQQHFSGHQQQLHVQPHQTHGYLQEQQQQQQVVGYPQVQHPSTSGPQQEPSVVGGASADVATGGKQTSASWE